MLTMSSTSNIPELDSPTHTHSSKILYLMNRHRKENTKLCDVNLQVNDKKYPAHRSVLAACSPYFLAMFNGDLKESAEKTIVLKDVKEDIIELIIDFVYTGNLNVNIENVESILEHATLLQFSEVRKLACTFLEEQLDPVNCVGIRKFVNLHNCTWFLEVVDAFIKRHFMDVINSEEFVSMPFDVLRDIISSNKVNVKCEEQVYNCVIKWVKHDPAKRKDYLHDLLAATRLPLLQKHFLTQHVDKEPLIKNDFRSRDLLDEAKNYYLHPENHANLRSPRTVSRHSTAGLLYVVGGKEAGEAIINKAECFSMFDNEWREIAALKRRRQQHGVCGLGNKLYAIAGSDGVNRLSSVEVYSPEKNKWQETTTLQTCRSGAGTGVLGSAIYALGGYDGRFCLGTVERFDPTNERWEYVAPINITRSFPGVAALNNRLFAIGGNDGTTFLDSCECFDPLTNRWSYITPMSSPRAGVGCAVLDEILYVAGGFDGTKRLDAVDMYDPRMNEWRSVSPMNTCRDGLRMVTYGGYIYAIGGIDGPSYLNTVEYYDPTADKWTESVPMGSARAAAGVAVLMYDVQ
ncbi:kelch-like protein 20 [Hydractinia symbiolongicarpus]|uniref:kelch-like protein 20 n=1 Tax=Hydractinia symbiolongicarpus TaxID=13093 RepID=UPI00254AA1E4|nr:kelch-like protein 20 [Hydractinia symbiolongicarpus]